MVAQRQFARSRLLKKRPESKPALPNKQSENYLALAKDAAKRLTSAGLIWGVALLVSFLLIDSEVSKRLDEIRNNHSNVVSLTKAFERAPPDKKQALNEKLVALKSKQGDLGAPITFPLPGLTPIPITPPLGPALWLLIAALVVAHLCSVRRHAHGYLALALLHTPQGSRGAIVAAPYRALLAPMPIRDGQVVSAVHYAGAYGVSAEASGRVLVGLAVICLVALQARMLWVQSTLATHIKPFWLASTLQFASLAVVGTTLFLCWTWLRSWRVPDMDFLPHGQHSIDRRHFLHVGLWASTVVAMGTVLPSQLRSEASALKRLGSPILAGIRFNPRFRRFAKAPDIAINLPDGPALNQRTGRVHFVSAGHLVDVGAYRTKTQAFMSLSLQRLQEKLRCGRTQLRHSHASFIVERTLAAAERDRRKGQAMESAVSASVDAEVALLMDAIRQDYVYKSRAGRTVTTGRKVKGKCPNAKASTASTIFGKPSGPEVPNVAIHLYDRMARTAAIADRADIIKELVEFMNSKGLAPAFSSRISKWSDSNSKWHHSIKGAIGKA